MASSVMHLAVAKKYYEKHPELNYEDLMKGALYPDAAEDDDKAHYTDMHRGKDNISHLQGKVSLYPFLEEHETLDSFTLGWFIHLITDYIFFDELFSKEYLTTNTYEEFCHDLYYGYECLNNYLTDKYHVLKSDYKAYPSEYYPGIGYHKCIFTKEAIDAFINKVSSIDIEKYILKILEAKKNVKP